MKKKVIGYLRVSSTEQSVSHQKSSILAYAKANNIIINEFIEEQSISAFKTHYSQREALMKCIEMASNNELGAILIFESSRLSRDMYQFQTIIDTFTSCGVKIISTSDNTILNQTEIDKLLNAFKGFMNEQSSRETSRRVKSAKALLKKQGLFSGGVIPPFMQVVDRKLVPIDTNLIREFYEDYIRYGSKYCMNKYNIQSRGTITRRIRNELYKPYVGELWTTANNIRNKRTCVRNETTKFSTRVDTLLLEGILVHDYCSSKLVANKKYENYYSFRCTKCRGLDIDVKKSFANNLLLPLVEKEIEQVLDGLDTSLLQEKYKSRFNKTTAILEIRINETSKTITDKEKAVRMAYNRLERAIMDNNDVIVNAVSNMINEIKEELESLKFQLATLEKEYNLLKEMEQTQDTFIQNVIHAKEIYKNANIVDKKAILNLLIKEVRVRDVNDFDIHLNI